MGDLTEAQRKAFAAKLTQFRGTLDPTEAAMLDALVQTARQAHAQGAVKVYWMTGPASENFALTPTYHAMSLLFHTTVPGWQIIQVEPGATPIAGGPTRATDTHTTTAIRLAARARRTLCAPSAC